jgi:hypothetical protein
MNSKKKANERPEVDVMFESLVKSGVIQPDVNLKQLMGSEVLSKRKATSMNTKKKAQERPDVDVMFESLVKSGVIKPDVTLKQLMEATKPLHGAAPEWGIVFDTNYHFCFWW